MSVRLSLPASVLAAACFVVPVLGAGASRAEPGPRIHVRGTSRIDARAARAGGKLVITGTLADDSARPLSGDKITIGVTPTNEAQLLSLSGAAPSACSDAGAGPTLERPDHLSVKADEAGRFCVRLGLPVDRYVAHLAFDASGNIDATKIDLPVDLALRALSLHFDPEPRALSLDGAQITLESVATIDEEGASSPAAGLPLALTNETGAVLASGMTNGSGRVRFSVAANTLGPPGKGELRVAFSGSTDTGSSVHVAEVERRTRVELQADDAPGGKLPTAVPEDGFAVSVTARTKSGTGTPTGSVEARVGDTIVGGAALEGGRARVVVTFSTTVSEVTLRLHYDSDTPWFEAGNEAIVTLPIREPSILRHVPILLAGLAVIAWLVVGRATRARAPKEKSPASRRPNVHGEARIEVVRAGPMRRGWSGHVVDAHEGSPVAGATVSIERAGFTGADSMARASTDEAGAFELPGIDGNEGDRLVVEGPLHAALRQPLPPGGELAVALVLRRRALLDRLVAWARRRGRPFDHSPEPTPGHVRRAAGAEFAVARWADAVERVAFGGGVVDARAEGDVDRLAPEDRPRAIGEPAREDQGGAKSAPMVRTAQPRDGSAAPPEAPLPDADRGAAVHDTQIDPRSPSDDPRDPTRHAPTLAGQGPPRQRPPQT